MGVGEWRGGGRERKGGGREGEGRNKFGRVKGRGVGWGWDGKVERGGEVPSFEAALPLPALRFRVCCVLQAMSSADGACGVLGDDFFWSAIRVDCGRALGMAYIANMG